MTMLIPTIVIAVGVIACVFDIRTRRIPNALTFSAALAGLLFHFAKAGVDGAQFAAGGWVVGLLLLLPYFALGGMGGGDVKLVAALGAWLPWQAVVMLLVLMSLAGGVLTLGYLIRHKLAKREEKLEIPYGVAIAFGGLWLISERFLNQFG